ncbi:hypothetical protein [Microcoleus sp. POL10_C6]|uniref:hypothetical protein n=1 Tax=unclassified Microcoleus TaxID=2642155 RepID=UPI002FD3057C
MTEGFNAADNSSIVPVILPIALDNCQNSVVGEAAGGKRASCEGFFRLTVEEFCENAIATIKRVMLKGDRIFGYLVVMLISAIASATPSTSHCLNVSSTNGQNAVSSH